MMNMRSLKSSLVSTHVGARSISYLKDKHFMCISQLKDSELNDLIDHSIALKKAFSGPNGKAARAAKPLNGISMSMIFQKRSTRTRVSTETGVFLLGGHALMLGPQDIQLGVNESMRDTANVLCRFNDLILARVFAHQDVEELAKYSKVPVINALSDKYHPLQTLADLMTLKEHFHDLKGKKLAWVGDGNNVLHDLMIGAVKLGMHVTVTTPPAYRPDEGIYQEAAYIAKQNKVMLTSSNNPTVGVTGAHVIVTDTWISMGQEEEAKQRKIDFAGYQVNNELMALAHEDAVFLHCLPRKQEEVNDDVFYSSKSLVFPEAENRMWTVMAVALAQKGIDWRKL